MAAFFGLSFYLLLLSQNIFNVSSIRTIPLYRAASTANFLATVFSAFCLFSVIHALNLGFAWNGLAVALISFPLNLQVLWTIEMEERVTPYIIVQSLIISLVLAEMALIFSFWPTESKIRAYAVAAVLTSAMYSLLGVTTHHLRDRLSPKIIREYLIFGLIVWFAAFFATTWTE